MIFILWIAVWLALNYFYWWLEFTTLICFLVWIFLIMPILLKIKFEDIKGVFSNKKLIWYNILINFIILPSLAFAIWYFVFWMEYYPYIFVLVLLAITPWGWLLMHRMSQTKSNLNIWFSLFAINLFLFSFFYIAYNFIIDMYVSSHTPITNTQVIWNSFEITKSKWLMSLMKPNSVVKSKEKQATCAVEDLSNRFNLKFSWCNFWDNSNIIYWFYWFLVLILIPFIISRIILLFVKQEHRWKIVKIASKSSKFAGFLLIVYIFSLSQIRQVLEIEITLIYKSIIGVMLFYLFIFFTIKLFLRFAKFDEEVSKSVFWNAYTRFITLALMLSVLYSITWEAPWVVIIPILAYFIQIWSSSLNIILSKNGDSSKSKSLK